MPSETLWVGWREKTKLRKNNCLLWKCLTCEDPLHTGPQQALLAKLGCSFSKATVDINMVCVCLSGLCYDPTCSLTLQARVESRLSPLYLQWSVVCCGSVDMTMEKELVGHYARLLFGLQKRGLCVTRSRLPPKKVTRKCAFQDSPCCAVHH